MKNLIKIISLLLFFFTFSSCEKKRTCECKNANGTYEAGEVEMTKHQAKKHCSGLSSNSTECYLK